ncbi:hypothetical protein EV715DRAFT_291411 [Schizophyllum commune]
MNNLSLDIYDRIWGDYLVNVMVLALLYGIHCALYLAAASAMSRRDTGRIFISAMTTLLFAASTIWFAVSMRLAVLNAIGPSRATDVTRLLRHIDIPVLLLARFNHTSSDVIVVWRAWVLWPESKPIRLSIILAILGTTVGGVMELIYSYSKYGVAACSFTLPKRRDNYIRVLTTVLPVLLTNVLVTTLVGIKIWAYRRSIKPALGRTSQTRVEKILFLLVESGGAYSCIWLAYLVMTLADAAGVFHVENPYMGPAGMLGTLMPAIAGVYPTLVVLLSITQSSPTYYISTNLVDNVSEPDGSPCSSGPSPKRGVSLAGNDFTYEVPLHDNPSSVS